MKLSSVKSSSEKYLDYDSGYYVVVTKRKMGQDYKISDDFWNKVKP